MFKITTVPSYIVYYEKVGLFSFATGHNHSKLDGCFMVDAVLTSTNADRLIEDMKHQFENRQCKLPFDKFAPVKVEEGTSKRLCVTEDGQRALEASQQVSFTNVSTCALCSGGCSGGRWLLPSSGKAERCYPIPKDWPPEAEFIWFLAGLYSKEDGWILPKENPSEMQ